MISKAHLKSTEEIPTLVRTVVAIDPAVTQNKLSNETGIVVCAKGIDEKFYVIDDVSAEKTISMWIHDEDMDNIADGSIENIHNNKLKYWS